MQENKQYNNQQKYNNTYRQGAYERTNTNGNHYMRLAIVRDKVEYENEYSCYDQSSIEQKG